MALAQYTGWIYPGAQMNTHTQFFLLQSFHDVLLSLTLLLPRNRVLLYTKAGGA
jgi:hypothetical protein